MPNQQSRGLGPHEALEVHELLRSEVTCYKKMHASIGMVQDEALRSFMQDTLQSKGQKIQQMEQFISGNMSIQ
jgi:similar to spore coat protein